MILESSPLTLSCLPLPSIFLRDELEWTRTRVAASEIRPLEASIIAKTRSHAFNRQLLRTHLKVNVIQVHEFWRHLMR